MARIPLRAYNREVENLIDRGQIEEAIAHCKSILKQFPKHIVTYRLLGKAYLESQRYAEAADILQRVLSVYPDDFVSQLGMSIIREDEGNLDASIWHMERAYEVQPFNRAVQDELRRLYGRRDGVEPPRIRLTRGALVRMYARGDLYPQAIAEIRAALAEDQKRVDLLVLLSHMYFQSGQKIEATEICSSLISKLPYCYEANRVLAQVLPETSRAEDARVFQQRLFALDPYAAFTSPNAPTSDQVPEQTVMVEKVDWQPSMTDAQSPDWARTIGLNWEEGPEENLPDWLNTITPVQTALEPTPDQVIEEAQPETPAQSEEMEIPEFLKDAGWSKSEGIVEETPGAFADEEVLPAEPEPVEADIPDWLQALAPEGPDASQEASPENMDWLESILPTIGVAAVAAEQPSTPDQQTSVEEVQQPSEVAAIEEPDTVPLSKTDISDLTDQAASESARFEWLQELPAEALASEVGAATTLIPQEVTAEPGSEELPEWLAGLALPTETEETAESELPTISEGTTSQETIPDWIRQAEEEQPAQLQFDQALPVASEEAQPAEIIPDWLKQLSTSEEALEPEAASDVETKQLQDILQATPTDHLVETAAQPVSVGEPASAVAGDTMDIDSALAWMEALAARQGADEESLKITSPDQRTETPPEWIIKEQEYEIPQAAAGEEVISETAAVLESVPALPEETVASEPSITSEELAALPQSEEPVLASLEPTQPVALSQAVEPAQPAVEMDGEAAFAWLEALAAKQGAEEETLITSPEDRSAAVAEWVPQLSESSLVEEMAPIEQISPLQEENVPTEIPVSELPVAPVAEKSSEQPVEETEIPDWLRTYEEDQRVQEPAWHPDESFKPESVAEEQLPDWLRSEIVDTPTRESQPIQTETAEAPAQTAAVDEGQAGMPDWLKALKESQPANEPQPQKQPEPSNWAPEYATPTPVPELALPQGGSESLELARASLRSGNIESAVEEYTNLINTGIALDQITQDLHEALDRHPVDSSLWQVLGDAYIKNDRVQEALDAYTKAEELLR
jgi:tetratricopeptide (TPR) repeat protein